VVATLAALAACASLAIGLATLWFGNMLGRVPLDSQSTFGYLLMLPLLLVVPAFSAAGLRLAWLALRARRRCDGLLERSHWRRRWRTALRLQASEPRSCASSPLMRPPVQTAGNAAPAQKYFTG